MTRIYHPFNLELYGRYFEAMLFIFKDLKDTVNTGQNISEVRLSFIYFSKLCSYANKLDKTFDNSILIIFRFVGLDVTYLI